MSHLYRVLTCLFIFLFSPLSHGAHTTQPLVVYVHETIYTTQKERFINLCDFPLILKPFSGADLLSKVLLERGQGKADVIVGLEGEQAFNEKIEALAEPLPAKLFEHLSLPFSWEASKFIPISYAYLSLLYKADKVTPDLENLEACLSSLPDKSLVMPDPRTSMVGRGGLSWLDPLHYKLLHQKVRTYPKGWSGAYALFQGAKVTAMLGYNTSVLLHHKKGQPHVRAALLTQQAHPVQVMTAFMLKKSARHQDALDFMRVLLSPESQSTSFEHYSYPVIKMKVPKEFEDLRPASAFVLKGSQAEQNLKAWMQAGYEKP